MKFFRDPPVFSITAPFAFVLSAVFLVVAYYSPDMYKALTDESTGVELTTAVFYLIAGVTLLASTIRAEARPARLVLPILLGLFFIFVAGEEESWGMWIFGFEAPEDVANINVQNEINIHNLDVFGGLLEPHRVLNMFIVLFAIVVPILTKLSAGLGRFASTINLPISDIRLVPWFLVALAYDRFAKWQIEEQLVDHWRHTEVAEFLYATGLLFFVILYARSRRHEPRANDAAI